MFIFHQKSNVDFRGELLFIDKSEFDNRSCWIPLVVRFVLKKLQDLDFIWAFNLKISSEVFISGMF